MSKSSHAWRAPSVKTHRAVAINLYSTVLLPLTFYHMSGWTSDQFVDASESAYGAKTKAAPLKTFSIPRLELKAAVLEVRLLDTIVTQHELPTKFSRTSPKLTMETPWLRGPSFIHDSEDSWPQRSSITSTAEELYDLNIFTSLISTPDGPNCIFYRSRAAFSRQHSPKTAKA